MLKAQGAKLRYPPTVRGQQSRDRVSSLLIPASSISDDSVSIVAVHGLYGNALKTWTSEASKALWLRDGGMLPKALPNARILSWGYNADVHAFLGNTSSDRIMQHAHTLVAQLQADREVCIQLLEQSACL